MKFCVHVVLFMLLGVAPAVAQLTIEITQGVEGAVPIAVVPFAGDSVSGEDVAQIVSEDLARSGRFEVLAPAIYTMRPGRFEEIDFERWRSLQADYLALGRIGSDIGGGFAVEVELADVFQAKPLWEPSFTVRAADVRQAAHRISDAIYEKLLGEKGAFSTRIAYITARPQPNGGEYTLVVADSDGHNPQIVLRASAPIMSPAWSPDGSQLAYVTFEERRAQIVIQNLYTGRRRTITDFPGINGAPAWSPDGRRLAFTLSKDGNPEIYMQDLGGGGPVRLTNNSAIDTEPSWMPDGRSLVFTSDRGGSPQLYRLTPGSGQPTRLTFDGDYNARASISPDGSQVALVHRRDGRFRIALLSLNSGRMELLTDGRLDESPSFSPNGNMIIYATQRGGRGELAAVSVDGRVQQSLVSRDTDVREPAWSNYLP